MTDIMACSKDPDDLMARTAIFSLSYHWSEEILSLPLMRDALESMRGSVRYLMFKRNIQKIWCFI